MVNVNDTIYENDYTYNSNPTQCDKIVRHLIDYGSITPLEALQEYGIMRLASRISELNKRGMHIVKTMEKAKNRYGEGVHYAKYALAE